MVFKAYSPHRFPTTMSGKRLKTTTRFMIHRSCQKTPKLQNINISLYRVQIHLPKKRKRIFHDPSKWPPRTPQNPPRGPLDPQGPSRSPWGLLGTVFSSFDQKLAGNPAPWHKVVEVLDSLLTFGHGDAAGLLTPPGRLKTGPLDPQGPSRDPPGAPGDPP